MDILAKPLSGNRLALSFINVSEKDRDEEFAVDITLLGKYFTDKIPVAPGYEVKNLWTGEVSDNTSGTFSVKGIKACDNITVVITPKNV